MSELLPILLSAGAAVATGGSSLILTGLSAAAAVAGGISSYQQGQIQADQAKLQARAAEVNGRMQALAVNQELLKTLSLNNAAAAASGLQSSGSVAMAQDAAQRQAAQELSINRFNTQVQKTALTAKATAASSMGKNALIGNLFDAVSGGYGTFKQIKETR